MVRSMLNFICCAGSFNLPRCKRLPEPSDQFEDQEHTFLGLGLAAPPGPAGHLVKPQQSASDALSQRISVAEVKCMNAMIAP